MSRSTTNATGSTGITRIFHNGHTTQINILHTIITTTTTTMAETGTGTETEIEIEIEIETEIGTETEKDTRTGKETEIRTETEIETEMHDNGTGIPIYTSDCVVSLEGPAHGFVLLRL